jgi:hypothetical protein
MARLSNIYKKKKGLAMNRENHGKMYVIETKIVAIFTLRPGSRKKGKKRSETSLIY